MSNPQVRGAVIKCRICMDTKRLQTLEIECPRCTAASLKDEITKEVWIAILVDQDRDQAAAHIIALVRKHMISDEAMGRAVEAYRKGIKTFQEDEAVVRSVILAALGDTHD